MKRTFILVHAYENVALLCYNLKWILTFTVMVNFFVIDQASGDNDHSIWSRSKKIYVEADKTV